MRNYGVVSKSFAIGFIDIVQFILYDSICMGTTQMEYISSQLGWGAAGLPVPRLILCL